MTIDHHDDDDVPADEISIDLESSNKASLFGVFSFVLSLETAGLQASPGQRSKCGHDLIPVNHTDGPWKGATGSLRHGLGARWRRRMMRMKMTMAAPLLLLKDAFTWSPEHDRR